MGLIVALLALLLLEGGIWALARITGTDYRIPPPLPGWPQYSALCPGEEEGTKALCGNTHGSQLMRTVPFTVEPTRPRVLVLGESFVYGLNLEEPEAWPARLEHHLGGAVEVLNFGRCGSESASLTQLVQAGVTLNPDVMILAIGNNEYTMSPYYSGLAGRHPIAFQRTAEFLSRIQLYGLLHRVAKPTTPYGFAKRLATTAGHPMQKYIDALHGRPVDTRVFPGGIVDSDVTEMLEDTKRLSERFYRLRLAGMIRFIQQKGIKVIMATLPHSLGDPPLLSGLHGAPREKMLPLMTQMETYTKRYREPLSREEAQGYASAIEGAIDLDDRFAYSYYARGRWKESQGDKAAAIKDHYQAISLDLVPDVTPEINGIITELSDTYNTPLVELHTLAEPHLNAPAGFFIDTIHVNALGADEIGAYVAQEVGLEILGASDQ